jgi:hypothetical protein
MLQVASGKWQAAECTQDGGKFVNVVLKSSHCHVGMPTSRKSFVGNQRIQVIAKSLPVVSTHYCPPNLPAHPSSLFAFLRHQ